MDLGLYNDIFIWKIINIVSIILYVILIISSFLWKYAVLFTYFSKKEVKKRIKISLFNSTILIVVCFVIPVIISCFIETRKNNIRKDIREYVLEDIQNHYEVEEGYLSIQDIKEQILKDYSNEKKVYYEISVVYVEDFKVGFLTYTDNSDDVSIYQYIFTNNGYEFDLKIPKSSLSKDKIEYDGIWNNEF